MLSRQPLLFVGTLMLAACSSGPTAVGVCKQGCVKSVGCTGGTTQQITDCQTACDQNAAMLDVSACTNGGDILNCLSGCTSSNCNDYGKCVGGCPKCVLNAGADLASLGSPNDLSGLNVPVWCADFCTKTIACNIHILGATVQECEQTYCLRDGGVPMSCPCVDGCMTQACAQFPACVSGCSMAGGC